MLKINSFGMTDVGLKRAHNEDAFVVRTDLDFVALADGMGGAAAGEVASSIFTETVTRAFSEIQDRSGQEYFEIVQNVFRDANNSIIESTVRNPSQHGMGCTAELAAFFDNNYIIGHVGDSRTYLFRKGTLRQITKDHSLVQDEIDMGIITPDQARNHSLKNVIKRAVGIHETLSVDILRGNLFQGDILLLCSDGLTDMIEDSSIQDILSRSDQLKEKTGKLIEAAKEAGGKDNITVILCEVL